MRIALRFFLLSFFIITQSAFAATLTESDTATITAEVIGSGGPTTPIDGNGSHSSSNPANAGIAFSGMTGPSLHTVLLQNGVVAKETTSLADGSFSFLLSGLTSGTYGFSLYSVDAGGALTPFVTYSFSIASGTITTVAGILLSPTIQAGMLEGIPNITGTTLPHAGVTLFSSNGTETMTTTSDAYGYYSFLLANLAPGSIYQFFTRAFLGASQTPGSFLVTISLGSVTPPPSPGTPCVVVGDVSRDCRVNFIDFSILSYWYRRSDAPSSVDLDGADGVTLRDFSILTYHWTG